MPPTARAALVSPNRPPGARRPSCLPSPCEHAAPTQHRDVDSPLALVENDDAASPTHPARRLMIGRRPRRASFGSTAQPESLRRLVTSPAHGRRSIAFAGWGVGLGVGVGVGVWVWACLGTQPALSLTLRRRLLLLLPLPTTHYPPPLPLLLLHRQALDLGRRSQQDDGGSVSSSAPTGPSRLPHCLLTADTRGLSIHCDGHVSVSSWWSARSRCSPAAFASGVLQSCCRV
jgi:hypothetical protein